MNRIVPVCLLAVLLTLPSGAWAQRSGLEIRLSDDLTVLAPEGWRLSQQAADSAALYIPLQKERPPQPGDAKNPKPRSVIASEAGMLVTVERRRDHAEAVRRLAEIASEYREEPTFLLIDGWPAIERRYRSLVPQPGEPEGDGGRLQTTFTTTAVAVGLRVVRFETMLAPDAAVGADTKLADGALAIGRNLRGPQGPADVSQRELAEIRRLVKPPGAVPAPAVPGPERQPRPGGEKPGVAVQVHTGVGEVEVATNDGQHVVVAANSGYSFSDNFGASFTYGGGTPCNQALCDGDPSLAVGNSGAIYYAWIGGATMATLANGVSRSIDNGHTFTFRGLAAVCPGITACTLPDQEHIAADRNHAAAGGGDRVYNVWRDFAAVNSIRISCSTDSGATWTAGVSVAAGAPPPRVSVGGDGFVYVAWGSGGNMMLHKYSNCDAGLTPQVGWPVTVSAFTNVACPVPGLDRCNGRNILSSPKVAVDDLDPNHIYYVFATATGAGNEDIMVFDSSDGGATFPRSVRVNDAVAGRRYMPWISTYGGIAAVSWYDRRTATAANNDRTRFHAGGVARRGPNLMALPDTDLSGVDDGECLGWPCYDATDATTDSESCSAQPQLAGWCSVSHAACDFSTPACPAGETCVVDRGCPKFGDYNGNAAGAGRAYSAWSSATPPAGLPGAAGTIRVYASADRLPSDFYVRDWNDSPASFDNGAQPSTHGNFWSTSDVWNQATNVAAAPGPGGFVAGDPPSYTGSNYVYARVSRRAAAMAGAPAAPVTAHFLLGDFGLGAAFTAIGDEMVTFAAGDMTAITPAHAWTVPLTASSHLCLAVQIDGPDGDTFAPPGVAGTAPGPADPLIVNDNNKAQRNLQDTIGTGAGTELIAMIRNVEKERRAIRLRVGLPKGVHVAALLDVIGGRTSEVADGARVEIGELAAGEIRWLRLRATSLAGLDRPVAIDVFEDTDPPANGFTILLHRESIEKVARRNLTTFAGVLSRLAKIENSAAAKRQAELALRASTRRTKAAYSAYLVNNLAAIRALVRQHLRPARGEDSFAIEAAAQELGKALSRKNLDGAAAAHTALMERLDAHLTAILRARR